LIGQGNTDKAYTYGGRSLVIQMSIAFLIGIMVILFAPGILQYYRVDPEVITSRENVSSFWESV